MKIDYKQIIRHLGAAREYYVSLISVGFSDEITNHIDFELGEINKLIKSLEKKVEREENYIQVNLNRGSK